MNAPKLRRGLAGTSAPSLRLHFCKRHCLAFLALFSAAGALQAEPFPDAKLVEQRVEVTENEGTYLDLDLEFTDADNQPIKLKEIFNGEKPVIFVPVYYRCPKLCNLTMNGVLQAINESDYKLGKDYRIVSVTINPKEGPIVARAKAHSYYNQIKPASFTPAGQGAIWEKKLQESIDSLKVDEPSEKTILDQIKSKKFAFAPSDQAKYSLYEHWKFLTGSPDAIKKVMKQVGFGYLRNGDDYAHKAVIIYISPDGKISRYFYGAGFPKRDYDLALTDAGQGKTGGILQQVMLYCFRYSPSAGGKYTADMWAIMRIGMLTVLAGLSITVFRLWQKERKRNKLET